MVKKKKPYIKKKNVKIGGLYVAKISGRLSVVKILSQRFALGKKFAGWIATNMDTLKKVVIRSHMKLRIDLSRYYGLKDEPQADAGTTGDNDEKGGEGTSPDHREHAEQIHG